MFFFPFLFAILHIKSLLKRVLIYKGQIEPKGILTKHEKAFKMASAQSDLSSHEESLGP